MSNYRIVAEVLTPADNTVHGFHIDKEVIWQGNHHPMGSPLPDFPSPELPAELGAVYLQRQRFMRLGWKLAHASVVEI